MVIRMIADLVSFLDDATADFPGVFSDFDRSERKLPKHNAPPISSITAECTLD